MYAENAELIHRYAVRRLGPSLGEDICSQTFIVAWERRCTYDSERGSTRAWLFGIATNLIRRHHRAEERRLRAYQRAAPPPAEVRELDVVESRVDARAAWPQVAAALRELRQDERDLLWLHVMSALTYEEVADVLGIPVGTVRSRLSRLRLKVDRAVADGTAGRAEPGRIES